MAFNMSVSNFSSRKSGEARHSSLHDLYITERAAAAFRNIFDIIGSPVAKNISKFSSRNIGSSENYSRFSSNLSGAGKNISRFGVSLKGAGALISKAYSLFREGYQLIAVDVSTGSETILGFIEKGNLTLSDFSLADGAYEIYAKYSGLFWDAAQDGKRLSVVISGGVISSSGLPNIRGLWSGISQGIRRIYWNIIPEYSDISGFALWFSAVSPVVTAGTPDVEISYFSGQSNYFYSYEQISTEYVAIKSYNNSSYGEVSELLLTFSSALSSPSNQYAIKE